MTADAVGGVWQYSLDLASALAERGVAVTLVAMGPSPRADQRSDAVGHGIVLLDAPYRLEWMDAPWDDVAAAGKWLLDIEQSLHPDVIHLNGYTHAALPWQAPAIVVAHSCVRSWWRAVHAGAAPPMWEQYTAEVSRGLQAARLVIAPTQTMLQAIRDEYGAVGRARVIANGTAYVDAPGGSSTKEEIVLSAGRVWDPAKNIESLFAVAPTLRWPVWVAGDTRAPDGSCAVPLNVRHLGRLGASEMREVYTRAAIYALPARYEPFGLSVLEAAAAGCALVLGDIASLRENWSSAAVFVRPDDRQALASAIAALIHDAARREELGARAMARAREFTLERMVDAYLDAYEEVSVNVALAQEGVE